jgi:hypothetical protein
LEKLQEIIDMGGLAGIMGIEAARQEEPSVAEDLVQRVEGINEYIPSANGSSKLTYYEYYLASGKMFTEQGIKRFSAGDKLQFLYYPTGYVETRQVR